jgi:uncharacterized protein YjlB
MSTSGPACPLERFVLQANGWVPNNPRLPVLVCRRAIEPAGRDLASAFEALFGRNGWPAQWRNGVYDFHHYHSTAHEVLGIASGEARLVLGGPAGLEVSVSSGDALVLPVGTGHARIEASREFLVVGAYPLGGDDWDLRRDAPNAEDLARMERLPIPGEDPVLGRDGPLVRLWRG